ncbi:MAG TPA: response regulator transcription factor [Euzebyales bacterium]|nr:response regulator transcription factor [Euzebyales bacterium]
MTANGSCRVLIADGRRLHGIALDAAFSSERDFVVVGRVDHGAAAVAQAEACAADVVIVDAELPSMGGVDVCARIKRADASRGVMILDDRPRPRLLLEAVEADANGYITRDVSFSGFMTAVRAITRGEISVPRAMQAALVRGLREAQREREQLAQLFGRLTRRELEVVDLLADGLNHHAVAEILCISPQTVRTHIQNALVKLEVGSRLEAAAIARRFRGARNGTSDVA